MGIVGGFLYLVHADQDRITELPGITILARMGAEPMPGDTPLPGGL